MDILLHKLNAVITPKNYNYKVIQYPVSTKISLIVSKTIFRVAFFHCSYVRL